MSLVRKRRKKVSLIGILLRTILVLVVLTIVGISAATGWYVNREGGVLAILEERLSSPEAGIEVSIGGFDWALQWGATPFVLDVRDVDITAGAQTFRLPQSTLYFGTRSLSTGGQPEILIVKGLEVDLTHDEGGWGIYGGELGFNAQFDAEVLANRLQDIVPQLGLRQLLLQVNTITIKDALLPELEPLTFNKTTIILDISELSQMSAKLRARQVRDSDNQSDTGRLALDLDGDLRSGFWQATVNSSELKLSPLQNYAQPFLPDSYVQFGDESLISGEMFATFDATQLQTATLDVNVNDATVQFEGLSDARGGFETLSLSAAYSLEDNLITILKAELELPDEQRLSLNGRLVNVHGESVGLSGTILAENVALKSIIDDWPENAAPNIRKQLDSALSSGYFSSLMLSFSGDYAPARAALSLSELSGQGNFAAVRLNTGFEQYRSVVGTLAGTVDVKLGAGGRVEVASVDAMMDNGFLILDTFGAPVQIPKAGINASYQPGTLFVETLFADFASLGSMTANLTVDLNSGDDHEFLVAAGISSDQMDVKLFQTLWPNQITKNTIKWVRNRVQGGQLTDATLRLQAVKKPDQRLRISDITGQARLTDTNFTWRQDSPQLTDIKADLSILNNQFDISIPKARIKNLRAEKANISFSPLVAPIGTPRNLEVSFSGAGSYQDMANLIDHPSVASLPASIKQLSFTEADATASVKFSSILDEGQLSTKELLAEGLITAKQLGGLPYDAQVNDLKVAVSIENERARLNGSGQFLAMPMQFTLRTQRTEDIVMRIDVPETSKVNDFLALATGTEITGTSSAQIDMNFRPGQDNLKLQITADLTNAGLSLPLLNFAKLPGEDGSVSFNLDTVAGALDVVEDLDLKLGALSAKGHLKFDDSNALKAGIFDALSLPGFEIDDLVFERLDAGEIQLSANAKYADLSPLLSPNNGNGDMPPLRFDITGDKLLIDDKISLSGHLFGSAGGDDNGVAKLLGDILIEDEPLITEGTISAVLGEDGPVIEGVGLVGGAEARLSFSHAQSGLPVLILTTANAGRVLRGLGITDAIRGGRMQLVNNFTKADLSDYDTVIELEEFNVIEAPAAIRAYSVLSVSGLYSLVEGDGTRFTRGEGRIKKRGDLLEFDVLRATGGAVGVYMVGSYNRNTGVVDVSGNLVPANQFSKILGVVPVLGEVLTGLDKSGLFATQFSLTGHIDDPDVQVNPSSLIAPGLLRDLFSPNWLKSEEKRILTPEKANSESLNQDKPAQ